MSQYIVGLDIGTTKIACFIGERAENGKIRIVGFGKTESVGVERGIVRNIRSTSESIRRAVADASEMAKYDVTEVYVGIAGQHIKSRTNRGSVMIPESVTNIHYTAFNLCENLQRFIVDQDNPAYASNGAPASSSAATAGRTERRAQDQT